MQVIGHNELTLVIGAGGGIGSALVASLAVRGDVIGFSRTSVPPLDLLDEASIINAVASLAGRTVTLVIDATGHLYDADAGPERSWRQLDPVRMARSFAVNAIGPALLMKHFLPLLPRDRRAVFATLSARVGSIGDNALGGWYSYRAAKAALNQLVRTAAIELARSHRQAICVALHPGTVATGLSAPFVKAGLTIQTPDAAAAKLLTVIDALTPAQSGLLIDYRGATLPF